MGRRAQQPAKLRAFHVAFRRALRHVPKRVSERDQPPDLDLELVGTRVKAGARQFGDPIPAEHALDLVQAEPRRLSEGYQRELGQCLGPVLAPQPVPSERDDQPDLLLVIAQRRGRHAASFR